jgi:small-conductance mechanosensitive channel
MKRDDLVDFTDEQKELVMTLYGKAITKKDKEVESLKEDNKNLTDKIATYETKINEFNETAKENADWKVKYEELQTSISEQEAKRKAEKEDDILTKNINDVFGDKKFVNEFTKNAIINEIKTALKDDANIGKSAKDLFEEITNGKEGIFANPNQVVDMPSIDENVENSVSKDDFDKMGYKERLALKETNPALFNKYNSM